MLGEFHGIDRKLDVHVALHLAAAAGVDEFLGRLGHDGVAVVIEPIDQGTDRRIFLIFDDRGVIKRAQTRSAALEFLEQALVIDVETERLGRRIEIGAIDEQRNLVGGRWHSGADLLQKIPQAGPANWIGKGKKVAIDAASPSDARRSNRKLRLECPKCERVMAKRLT
jgi:hypothetical protein